MTLCNNRKTPKILAFARFLMKNRIRETKRCEHTPGSFFWSLLSMTAKMDDHNENRKKNSHSREKNICGRQELDRTGEKNLKHLFHAVYWFLLNCQRSIFLTVPIIFRTRFYQAVSNALDGSRKTRSQVSLAPVIFLQCHLLLGRLCKQQAIWSV